jgi:ribosome-binding protein aMBF1 (putative translation factor)
MILRRRRFADLIRRQLDVFAEDQAHDIFAEVHDRKSLYDRADRDDAEELYGDYMDAVETATEALADMRDRFARTLDDDAAEVYELEFNRAVKKRWPPFGLEIDLR